MCLGISLLVKTAHNLSSYMHLLDDKQGLATQLSKSLTSR